MSKPGNALVSVRRAVAAAAQPGASIRAIFEHFFRSVLVGAVYGAPIKEGRSLVIPAAEVVSAFGFGFGGGGVEPAAVDGDTAAGSGGGGGGYGLARPVALIVMTPEGVRQEPIVDLTKLGLAAFTAIGVVATMAYRLRRGR
jgi:uncharacterized spore protein YtfJ